MKLKKIASLMLAGIMAVSMLAGCKDGAGNNGGQLPPEDDDNATGYSVEFGGKVSDNVKKLTYINFADNADADKALEDALGNLGFINSTMASLPQTVHNLAKDAEGSTNIDGTIYDRVMDEASLIAMIDDFADEMEIANDWLNADGIATYAFNSAEDSDTESVNCGALFVVDGSVKMDKVLNQIASQLNGYLAALPNTDAKYNASAFSVTYDYNVSVSVVNKAVSAVDWYNGSANFIAVVVTRVPTQA